MAFSSHRLQLVALVVLAAAPGAGCTPIRQEAKSPLAPPQMSPDSVVLDIFTARFPQGEEDPIGPLWNEVDEQAFPAEVRRRLAENGFRVGVVGDRIPAKLAQLLELKDQAPKPSDPGETLVTNLESEPRVVRRHLQLRANQQSEIVTSEVYDQLAVLIRDGNDVYGRPYPKAKGVLQLKSTPDRDGRVRVELLPQLQYGEVQQRFTGSYGAFKLETGPSRRDFDSLAMSAALTPGSMIVLSSVPNRSGALGHHFFTCQSSGKLEQKLLVIRLSQTQHDDLFDPQDPVPLDLTAEVQEGSQERPRPARSKASKAITRS